MRKIFTAFILLAFTGCAFAEDIDLGEGYHRPQGFSSIYITNSDGTAIQNAVENIQDGGTIILSGDFKLTRGINIKKSLTIKCEDANNRAVLDLSGVSKAERVLRCQGDSITLENLIITGGYSTNGGGVKVDADTENMTITNCDIRANKAIFAGGGIYSDGKNLTLTNCNITSNDAMVFGGGVVSTGGTSYTVTMTNCEVTSNYSKLYGGGLYFIGLRKGNANMNNCKVTKNTADKTGGDIYLSETILTMTSCDVLSSDIFRDAKSDYTQN